MRCNLGKLPANSRLQHEPGTENWKAVPLVLLPHASSSSPPSAISRVRFSPDGCRLAACHHDGGVTIWDTATGALQRTLKRLHSSGINDLCWGGAGGHIFTGSSDGTAACVDVRAASPIVGRVAHAAASAELEEISRLRSSKRNLHHSQQQQHILEGCKALRSAVTAVASPPFTGQTLLTGSFAETVCQWDLRSFAPLNDVRAAEGFVASLEFLGEADDTVLIVSDSCGSVGLYDSHLLEPIKTLGQKDGALLAHAFSVNEGREVCCIPIDGPPRLIDTVVPENFWNLIAPPLGSKTSGKLLDREFLENIEPDLDTLLKPRQPKYADPFVGNTAVEFLTANGPYVFGAEWKNCTIIPAAMKFLAPDRRSVLPPHFPSAHIWSTCTGNYIGSLSRKPHSGADMTSVTVHPDSHTALIATSGAQPDCSVVIWSLCS